MASQTLNSLETDNMNERKAFGIKDIQLPIRIKQRIGGLQYSVATTSLRVISSKSSSKDIMPVLTSALNCFSGDFSVTGFTKLISEIQEGVKSQSTKLEIHFPYFIEKEAPVTKTKSLLEYGCTFTGLIDEDSSSFTLCVHVPVTTLCPCSKEISLAGAHNQRAEVNLCITFDAFIWLEELIDIVESSASCELFALLKRPDEKFVTEEAYNNPMFVEDVVRKVAENAHKHPHITWFSVGVESFESIHKHSAYAYVDSQEIEI